MKTIEIDVDAHATVLREVEAAKAEFSNASARVKRAEDESFYANEALEKARKRLAKSQVALAESFLKVALPALNEPIVLAEVKSQ